MRWGSQHSSLRTFARCLSRSGRPRACYSRDISIGLILAVVLFMLCPGVFPPLASVAWSCERSAIDRVNMGMSESMALQLAAQLTRINRSFERIMIVEEEETHHSWTLAELVSTQLHRMLWHTSRAGTFNRSENFVKRNVCALWAEHRQLNIVTIKASLYDHILRCASRCTRFRLNPCRLPNETH